jgi:hypothetical protein
MNLLTLEEAFEHVRRILETQSIKVSMIKFDLQIRRSEWDVKELKDNSMLPLGISPS